MSSARWTAELVADEPYDLYRVVDSVTGIYSRNSFQSRESAKTFAAKANRKERKYLANQNPSNEE